VHEKDQIEAFGREVDYLVDRYYSEFDLTPSAMVGVLTMVATRISCEQFYEIEDEDDFS
jgi:hypothetical protein